MSRSGKHIYLCVKGEEKDIKRLAQQQKYSLKLEVGFSDWPSLEPCDTLLRPLNKICPPEFFKEEVDQLEDAVKKQLDALNVLEDSKESKFAAEGDEENETGEEMEFEDEYTNTSIFKSTWRSYIEFLKNMAFFLEKGVQAEMINERKGVFLRTCCVASLKFANAKADFGGKLHNLWDRLGKEAPLGASAPY